MSSMENQGAQSMDGFQQQHENLSKTAYLLLHYDDEKKCLLLDKTALAMIKNSPEPFCILAAVGDARIGKSTFLNGLISICAEQIFNVQINSDAFRVGHDQTACTQGVWVKLIPFNGGTLMLLDVEGINLGDDIVTTQLSLFTTLIASEIMLFGHKVLNNNAIRFLHHIARLKEIHFEDVAQAQVANVCVTLHDPLQPPGLNLRDYVAKCLTQPSNNADNLDECRRTISKYIKYEEVKALSLPVVGQKDRRQNNWPLLDEEYRQALETAAAGLHNIRVRSSLLGGPMDGTAIVDAMYRLVGAIATDEWNVWAASSMDFEERLSIQAYNSYIKPLLEIRDRKELEVAIPEALKMFKDKCKLEQQVVDAENSLREHIKLLELQEESEKARLCRETYDALVKPLLVYNISSEELQQKIPSVLQSLEQNGLSVQQIKDAETYLLSHVKLLKAGEEDQLAKLTREAYEAHILPLLSDDISIETLQTGIPIALQNFMAQCQNETERQKFEGQLKEHLELVELRKKLQQEESSRNVYETYINPLLGEDMTSDALQRIIPNVMQAITVICSDPGKLHEMRATLDHRLAQLRQQENETAKLRSAECYAQWIAPLLQNPRSSVELKAAIPLALSEYRRVCPEEKDVENVELRLKFLLNSLEEKEKLEQEKITQRAYDQFIRPLLENHELCSEELLEKIRNAPAEFEAVGGMFQPWMECLLRQQLNLVKRTERERELQQRLQEERQQCESYKNRSIWKQIGSAVRDLGTGIGEAIKSLGEGVRAWMK